MPTNTGLRIGLALGSGAARGWSHIGVIHALAEMDIVADVVCGTSIGALVGASYVSGRLDRLEEWACSLTRLETARFFEINASLNGFVNSQRLRRFLNETVASDDDVIESFAKDYSAISTDLETGREVWLTKGSLLQAVWASIALPGLFPAIKNERKWLVDGGLVNPVPVSVCRALGADIVIAVNLNDGIVGKHFVKAHDQPSEEEDAGSGVGERITGLFKEYTSSWIGSFEDEEHAPGLLDTIAGSINITQDRITRSRLAGDPADVVISPDLSALGLLEFYRAREAIDVGRSCVHEKRAAIENVL